jgi:hypothetical protein
MAGSGGAKKLPLSSIFCLSLCCTHDEKLCPLLLLKNKKQQKQAEELSRSAPTTYVTRLGFVRHQLS